MFGKQAYPSPHANLLASYHLPLVGHVFLLHHALTEFTLLLWIDTVFSTPVLVSVVESVLCNVQALISGYTLVCDELSNLVHIITVLLSGNYHFLRGFKTFFQIQSVTCQCPIEDARKLTLQLI